MRNSQTTSIKRSPKRESISAIETARTGRQDFPTDQTLKGDISSVEIIQEDIPEDIIIKCSLEQVIKNFFQDYVIVWYDPNINSQENQQHIAKLKKFCDVLTFTEWQNAKDYVQSTHTACHVITSGTNGELLVKEISPSQNVANIYVFCRSKDYHSAWTKNYSQVSCVETDIESLLFQIKSNLLAWYKQASSLKLNLPAFAPIFNETDKSQMNNLHRFLKVIPNFQNRTQAKNDFLNLSKAIYSDPLISEFEHNYNEYDKEQTLRWYTQESFLYKVTNNCLRIATSDSIQYCRLLLQDIEKAIKEQYQTKSKNFNGLLYRGAYLSAEEWSNLKLNLGQEIEMHGFLSVSKVKNIGLNFMKADPSKKVFITIIVPQGPNQEEQGFAEVQEFSQYPQEKEILFNARSRFTILETEDEPYRHLVLLYGAQGFRKYLADKNPVLEVPIPSQKDFLCSQCKATSSKQIFFISLIDQKCFCEKCINHNSAPFLYIPSTQEREKPSTIKISGFLLKNFSAPELPFYGYKCSASSSEGYHQTKKQKPYFFVTCTDCHQQWCQNCFKDCLKAGHSIILETSPFTFWSQKMPPAELNLLEFQNELLTSYNPLFQQADMYFESQLYEKAIEYYSIYIRQNEAKGKDNNFADCLKNLGYVFQKQGEHTKALECYSKSLDIFKSISGDNRLHIATIYLNIGSVYDGQGEYTKALESYLKSLDFCKSVSEGNEVGIYNCYNGIGLTFFHQSQYNEALEYYFKAVNICRSVGKDHHPDLAILYSNIGQVYHKQGEYAKELEYTFKALEIQKIVYGDNHPGIAISLNNIGLAFFHQVEYNKALEYYFKAVNICKSVGGDNHPDLALFYNNIGMLYNQQGEYKKALEYSFKALQIEKSVYGDNHPGISTSLNSIGLAFYRQGEYNKTLEYYFKALDICKAVYGDNHPDVATCYQSIGSVFNCQGEYAKALEYTFKALGIQKSVYGDNHPAIATSLNNIGMAFCSQGEEAKALEYFFQSLEIQKSVYGDNHPDIAISYNNIGQIYNNQREYTKALEYSFKGLQIQKSVYGDNHLTVATSLNNIGRALSRQGKSKEALEYYFKALNIYKSVVGDNHPNLAVVYENIGLAYTKIGEYRSGLEYYLKTLEVQKSVYGDNHSKTLLTQEMVSTLQSFV